MLLIASAFAAAAADRKQEQSGSASDKVDFGSVKRFISEEIRLGRFPSVAVAVSRGGHLIWEDAFGLANKEKNTPATPHTLYHLASVTKTFTAAAIMIHEERGLLELDRPVNEYLSGAKLSSRKWNPGEATIRQIATHTAGLTTYDQACFKDAPVCDTSFDTMIRRYGVIFWKPGTRFDYSNLGYGVLSAVIEHVSKKRFSEFLRDELFAPLGMTECAIDASAQVATPYDEHGAVTLSHSSVAQGATSACCSADSLLKFAMFNLNDRLPEARRVISDRGVAAMHDQTVSTGEPGHRYGLGWWVNENQHGYRGVYDAGGTVDSKALLYTVPSKDIAVIVLANGPALDADKVVDRILGVLLPDYGRDLAKSQEKASTSTPAPNPPLVGWPKGVWVGEIETYEGNKSLTIKLGGTAKGSVKIESQPPVPIDRFRMLNNGFVVRAKATIDTSDAKQHEPYVLGFELYRDGDSLYGAATTWSQAGARDGGLFSYFVTLKRSRTAGIP